MPHYHLSYDTIDCEKHFKKDYNEAKRYLLCILLSIPNKYLKSLGSLCESTIIIEITDKDSDRLFEYLKDNLSKYFYFVVSEISKINGEFEIEYNLNQTLNDNFKNSLKDVVCDNLLQQIKTQY